MGGVVSAIGDAVGGVVDAVGDIAEAAVDVVGDVVEVVADNPILLAAAIATPVALSAMSTSAVGTSALAGASASAGVSASSMGLIGPTLMGAEGATAAALSSAAYAAGAGAGVLGGGALAGGLTLAPALAAGSEMLGGSIVPSILTTQGGLGATTANLAPSFAGGGGWAPIDSISNAFNFASSDQAANFGSSVLQASNSSAAAFTPQQTAAQSILGNNVPTVFQNEFVNPALISDATKSVNMISQGVPFSQAVPTTTPMTDAFMSNIKDVYGKVSQLSDQAESIINKVGQTILPDAPPELQNLVSKTAMNTVTTGGDIEKSLKQTLMGVGPSYLAKEVTQLTDPLLGEFGSKLVGGATGNTAGALLAGATPEQALMGAGMGATGSAVTNLTGSPLIGGAARTAVGSALSGRDVGQSLLGYGINAGVDKLSNQLVDAAGIPTTGFVGRITRPIIGSLEDQLRSSIMPSRPSNIQQAARPTNVSPLNTTSLTKVLQSKPLSATNQSTVQPSGVLPTSAPAQKVDVSKLKPVDISTLGLKT